jgi:hypothetical protein
MPPCHMGMLAREIQLACEACGGLALGNPARQRDRGCQALPNVRRNGTRQQRVIALAGPTATGLEIDLYTGTGADRGAHRAGTPAHPNGNAVRAKAGRRCHPVPWRSGNQSSGHNTISSTVAAHVRSPHARLQTTDPTPVDASTSSARSQLRADLSKRKRGFSAACPFLCGRMARLSILSGNGKGLLRVRGL